VRRHLDAGDLCVVVTATNSFVTGPIARAFGIANLIATIPGADAASGRFSGAPTGIPSFQAGKIARVEAWLVESGHWWGSFEQTWFYSDSHNDLPLMKKVSHPVAVDPDPTLKAHAEALGWQVLSLR
jgi:phosphoserine phosphatase